MRDEELETHGWTISQWLAVDPWPVQRRIRRFATPLIRLMWRQRHLHTDRLPESGAVLLCPNHTAYSDFCAHGLGYQRVFRVMAKSEAFSWPVIGPILRNGGGFPVERGKGDAVAIDLATRVLRDGQMLLVYPEGTRCRIPGEMRAHRRGAARLALASGCTVAPVGTYGLQPGTGREHLPAWLRRLRIPGTRRVTTVFGEPLHVPREDDPSRERVDEVRDEIRRRVGAAFEQARRWQLESWGRD